MSKAKSSGEVCPLPLRFKDDGTGHCQALMPSQCREGCEVKGLFKCASGEIVKVEWCGVYRNEKDACEKDLERIAQNLYGWSFARVSSTWIARLGKVDVWWDWLKMEKL